MKAQINDELDRWVNAIRDKTRTRPPQYLIVASNVRLSPKGATGGIDSLTAALRTRLRDPQDPVSTLKIREIRIWHADQIHTYLDTADAVRHAFPALLTVGDVFARIGDHASGAALPDLAEKMRLHAGQCLRNEHWIRFSEAGSTAQRATLEQIGIDLPGLLIGAVDFEHNTSDAATTVATVAHIIGHGDAVLQRSLTDRVDAPHLVIIGGPGQGKTTLSKLVAQAYRVALLRNGPMTPEVATIVADTQAALARNGIPEPGNLRWPMRVDLSQYAEELAATPDKSLFAHLSNAIAMRTDAAITASDLQSWLRAWPWVVILDGLDEVSTVNQRRVLLERVTDFIETADSLDADLMLVATTRPLGYDERFDPDLFDNIWLRKLDQRQAMSFASEMVHHRLGDDPDLADRVIKRLSTASGESATRRLMETPLQVAIMSFIVEGYGALPVDRFGMFSLYYRTVYQREVDKPSSPLTRMLNAHRSDINYLHERVALQLHVAAEAGSTKPTIPLDQLEMLVRRRLQAQGYEPRQVDTITTQLVETATHRLVLLIPEGQHVGFEIRSLQELLAALAMTNGPENRALQQLRLTMHHPHWRNIWLLAAGRLFKEREHLHTELHDILTHGDGEATPLFQVMPSAPTLACDILDDGFASQAPLSRRRYLRQALRAIDYPAGPSHRLATAVARACQNNDDRDLVFSVLADAMRQTDVRQINAYTLAAWLGSADPGLDSRSERFIKHQRVHLSEQSRQVLASKPPAKKLSELIWRTRTSHRDDSPLEVVLTVLLAQHELENQTDTLGLDADEVASLATVLQSVIDRTSQAGSASATDDGLAFVAGSETGDGDGVGGLDDLAEAQVAALLQSLPPRAWQMVILVSAALGPYLVRRAVGAQILVAFED